MIYLNKSKGRKKYDSTNNYGTCLSHSVSKWMCVYLCIYIYIYIVVHYLNARVRLGLLVWILANVRFCSNDQQLNI